MSEGAKPYLQLQVGPRAEAVLELLSGKVSLPVVLLELLPEDEQDPAALKRLIQAVQNLDAAALVKDNIEMAKDCKADGVHLSANAEQMTQYERARNELAADSIVGASAGLSRHTAMVIGEAGADYVSFEITDTEIPQDKEQDEHIELLGWWSELFEIPCVALSATDPAHGERLADAGADFVGYTPLGVEQPSDIVEQIQTFNRMLSLKSEQATIHG